MNEQHAIATQTPLAPHAPTLERQIARGAREDRTATRPVPFLVRTTVGEWVSRAPSAGSGLAQARSHTAAADSALRLVATRLAAAVLAAVISLALLAAVAGSLRREGIPFAPAVAAERACADRVYVSEREACMRAEVARMRRAAT